MIYRWTGAHISSNGFRPLFRAGALLLAATARPLYATRAALVGGGGTRVGEILSLAEAKLAGSRAVQLVERREVERVLAEQKVSLGGFATGEQAISTGKLLSAELLVIVESDNADASHPSTGSAGSGQAGAPPTEAGLIIFDAVTGVWLWDATVDLHDPEQAAGVVADAVERAEHKRDAASALRPICVLAVRNADLPRGMDSVCDAVGQLLQRDLVASPSLALLERSRLDELNKESALSGAAANDAFLGSVVAIEMEVGRPAGGAANAANPAAAAAQSLHATAVLTDAKGKDLGKAEFTVSGQDPAGLAEGLGAAIAKQLNVTGTQ